MVLRIAGYFTAAVIALVVFSAGADSAQNDSLELIKADGVQEAQMTGWAFFGCSNSDTFSYGFRGLKNGARVEGVVCSGFLKGATIRYTRVTPVAESTR